ncbi:MAG: fumarylacetoacetate hydrolase family protein [Pseudomonadota bacterium]
MKQASTTPAIADALWHAMQQGRRMPPEWAGRFSLREGYEVQLDLMRRQIAAGDRQTGWKVGLTAKAMQTQQNVHEPCFGYLLESAHHGSGQSFRFDELTAPGFENELCLTVGKTLRGPGVTLEDVLNAVSHAAPALEIVEVRGPFAGNLPLAMADNAQQKAYVTGEAVSLTPASRDLSRATVEVVVNGSATESASGAAVMGGGGMHSVMWLANKLAEFDLSLDAGMEVMSGSFTRQYAAQRGTAVRSMFTPFGPVSASFF